MFVNSWTDCRDYLLSDDREEMFVRVYSSQVLFKQEWL